MNDDWLAILPTALPVSEAIQFANSPSAGAINSFLGTTREEKRADGTELLSLDYEAYESMAVDQFKKLSAQAREKWPIQKLVILHRIGRVAIGEPSVFLAVSTPHRADSFAACQWLIDSLKQHAAIWKKEVWSAGTATWSGER